LNAEEAKQTLEHYRTGDEVTEQVAEALACARSNTQLARWFSGKELLSRQRAAAVQQTPVAPQLVETILAQRRIVPVRSWWNQPIPLAAAAVALGLVAIAGFFATRTKQTFAAYRQAVVDESWGRAPHLDYQTSDIGQFNQWLGGIDPHTSVTIPSGLQDLNFRGGRTMEWNGQRVVLLCFAQGTHHLHLFVTGDHGFVDVPPQTTPDYEKCSGWKTVTWSQGDRTYVLTGMNYLTFLKKFRHAGHWTMDG